MEALLGDPSPVQSLLTLLGIGWGRSLLKQKSEARPRITSVEPTPRLIHTPRSKAARLLTPPWLLRLRLSLTVATADEDTREEAPTQNLGPLMTCGSALTEPIEDLR
jgi:hypothetical protein